MGRWVLRARDILWLADEIAQNTIICGPNARRWRQIRPSMPMRGLLTVGKLQWEPRKGVLEALWVVVSVASCVPKNQG